MTTDLLNPIDAPALAPLSQSFDYDQLESELKTVFMTVFESLIRPRERELNLYGMPHLGDTDLIERALKDAGLAIIRRDAVRQSFLLKAATARNPRRGLIFLRAYLQSAWPNVWQIEPLWHPIATAANYPADRTALGTKVLGQAGTATVSAVYDSDSQDGIPVVYRTDWQGQQQLYTSPRTNWSTYSQDFSNAVWTKAAGSVVMVAPTGAPAAPDGTATASKLNDNDTSTAYRNLTHVAAAIDASKLNTVSAFGVPAERRYLLLRLLSNLVSGNYCYAVFDLVAGTFVAGNAGAATGATASMEAVNNGWYRCALSGIANAGGGSVSSLIAAPLTYSNTTSYAGVAGAGIYIWGSQLEVGALTAYHAAGSTPNTLTDYTMGADGVATFADGVTPASPLTHFLTGRIRVTLPVTTDNGLGLLEIAKAFRSTLAPRLMLELRLSTIFENIGDKGGLVLANGASAVMPLLAVGKLQ